MPENLHPVLSMIRAKKSVGSMSRKGVALSEDRMGRERPSRLLRLGGRIVVSGLNFSTAS